MINDVGNGEYIFLIITKANINIKISIPTK